MAYRGAHRACLLAALLLLASTAGRGAGPNLTSNQTLTFGRFAAGTGGTITVSPAGARSRSGGVILLNSIAGAATYTYSDTDPKYANSVCIISLPADGSVVLTSGSDQMQLTAFTSNPSGAGVMNGGTLQFAVGATLAVGANQRPGTYSGAIPLTIQYQ